MLGDQPPPLLWQGRDGEGSQHLYSTNPLPASPFQRKGEELSLGNSESSPSPLAGEGLGRGGERVIILPLHGELPITAQAAVLAPHAANERRVVLATNVAESSVTLPGVRVVIDSGLAREPRFDPNSGFSRLQTVAISQASAEQRAGRAGRVAAGWAYRLWPESKRLEPQRRAEIAQVDLAGLALEMAAWGAASLRFLDPPPAGTLAAGRDLLRRLGALEAAADERSSDGRSWHGDGAKDAAHAVDDDGHATRSGRITPLGRRMLALGTHPRLAAMLLAPMLRQAHGDLVEAALACDLAALTDARDPLRSRSDALAERWQALAAFRLNSLPSARRGGQATPSPARRGGSGWGSANAPRPVDATDSQHQQASTGGDAKALAAIDQTAKQWRRRLRLEAVPPQEAPAHLLGDLLAHAFPDRIAHQSAGDPLRYQLANGRSARLFPDSVLYGVPWIVIAELRDDPREAQILRAAPLDEARLERDFSERFIDTDVVRWDASARALVSRRERRFDGIVLESRSGGRIDPQHAAQALCDAIGELGLNALPWTDNLRQWRDRVRCLRAWMPELDLPDLSDAALLAMRANWLQPALLGKTRLDAIGAEEFNQALHGLLDWNTRSRVDMLAPTRVRVPSGLERSILYAFDDDGDEPVPPVLAVKLQELFGLADTPRIADGRAPLTLHLLSPGGKPLQVTQDLRGFWDRTYPEVRKEMKGRYPRHPWPDDPWSATATHRAKPRGT
ncbi:MAG: ATP-dependent helicase HrpB [Proteobacteria bacterium]|nr:ATP-dependent helicase HrpB [Pseudomonadota bacterium]